MAGCCSLQISPLAFVTAQKFFSPSYFVAIFKEQRLEIRGVHFARLRIGLVGTEETPLI
jgi:hypothetical protein